MNRYFLAVALILVSCGTYGRQEHRELQIKALSIIREALLNEKQFVKVHAAEFLAAYGFREEARSAFQKELELHGDKKPYRIGIYRVLARTGVNEDAKAEWILKLRDVFLDQSAEDRSYALESLGKLNYQTRPAGDEQFENYRVSNLGVERVLAEWVLARSLKKGMEAALLRSAKTEQGEGRGFASVALRSIPNMSSATRHEFLELATAEPYDSKARVYFDGTAVLLTSGAAQEKFRSRLLNFLSGGTPKEKYEACLALAGSPNVLDLPRLIPLLEDPNADVRISASNVILAATRFRN